MPTYQYICEKCKIEKEIFHAISDGTPRNCDKCGKRMKKLIGKGTGIIFKGSGFYENDYKKKK